MRLYKQVSGKCFTCALLTGLRSKFTHPKLKHMATALHALHRDTYMAEREAYYKRRKEALDNPDEVMSVISDGMAQTHTALPYYGNLSQNSAALQQKVQGVLDHGRSKFSMYLCMHSCPSGTSLAIHTFYLQLEEWRADKGHYPTKVYWQIDGGPENANRHVYAFAEYLVSKTPIKEFYVTRLPVGHTHEDIDARFGTIWDHIKLRYAPLFILLLNRSNKMRLIDFIISAALYIPLKPIRRSCILRFPIRLVKFILSFLFQTMLTFSTTISTLILHSLQKKKTLKFS